MKVMHQWSYFTGSNPKPKAKNPKSPTDAEIEAATEWEYQDSVAGYLLSQCLPDMTVMRLNGHVTMEEQWTAVTKEYQAKSAYAQADLHQAFLDIRCTKGGDIREFLANLGYKREELAAASVDITDKEYECTIL